MPSPDSDVTYVTIKARPVQVGGPCTFQQTKIPKYTKYTIVKILSNSRCRKIPQGLDIGFENLPMSFSQLLRKLSCVPQDQN